jgi:hypothetical protein
MPAEARISPIWKKQKLFVALFLIAIGGWFFFDGLIGYPRSNERFEAHQGFEKEGRLSEWPAYAQSRGWVAKPPEKLYKREDIVGQFVFGGLGVLAGSIVLVYWLTQKNRIIRTDEEAIYTPAGTRVPFEAVTGIGKKRWESKGIAVVRYALAGRKGEFIVDDYKFDTDPSRQILTEIEEKLVARTAPAAGASDQPA